MTKAIIYARISKDRVGAGLGVERQAQDCRELAERLGWSVLRVESDNDISAYSGKPRPAYRRTLAALESGEANAVIAWHTDRLHRRNVELEPFLDVVERTGAQVATVKAGPVDLASPSGRMTARILGAVAQQEVEHNRQRVIAEKRQALAAGKYRGGRRPFGYEADGVTVREDEAEAIRRATTALLAGESVGSIVRLWNDTFAPPQRARQWSRPAVTAVLKRARNAGKTESKGEIVGDALWPAIVPLDDVLAVRAMLSDPSRRTAVGAPRRWQGSNVYICAETGEPMTTAKARDSDRREYRPKSRRAGVCVTAELIDEYVSTVICERLSRPDARELLSAPGIDTGALTAKRAGIEARLDESAGLYAAGVLTAAQLTRATTDLRAQLDAIDSELASAVNDADLAALVGAEDVRATWDALAVDTRARIIRTLVRVTVSRHGERGKARIFTPDAVSIEWLND